MTSDRLDSIPKFWLKLPEFQNQLLLEVQALRCRDSRVRIAYARRAKAFGSVRKGEGKGKGKGKGKEREREGRGKERERKGKGKGKERERERKGKVKERD